tara:strand:- start:12222 stop:13313 length:1092 start_codon:yes stop_codon:yes gene_type:complete
MRILIALLFLASSAFAQEPLQLKISGATEAYVGDKVVLTVNGLPEVDTTQTIDEALQWTKHLNFVHSSPDTGLTVVEPQLIVRLTEDRVFVLQIVVMTTIDGTVVVVGDYNQEPFQVALHRIEFVHKEPPPDTGLIVSSTINKSQSPVQVVEGAQVLYTFLVKTKGDRPVKDIAYESSTGLTLIGPNGDINENGLLDVSEAWEYSALALAKKGTVTDTTKFSGNVGKYEARGSVESTYTTTDAPPDPTPDPTPDPDVEEGPRWILVVHEVQDGDPAFQNLLADFREVNNKDDADHTLVIVDDDINEADGGVPDWYKPYAELLDERNQKLPAIVITDDQGKLIKVGDLPKSVDEYKELIKSTGG